MRTMFTMPTTVLLRMESEKQCSTSPIMSNELQFRGILPSLLVKRGVDWMKRRTKTRMTAIHVSIPVRLLEDFDETLSFSQSRSAKISTLIDKEINGDGRQGISDASTRQLMAALSSRTDVDPWFKEMLVGILLVNGQKPDEQSS